jgi:hypothetical protein
MFYTYKVRNTIYFIVPTHFNVNMFSQYFGLFQNPLIMYQIEISKMRGIKLKKIYKTIAFS